MIQVLRLTSVALFLLFLSVVAPGPSWCAPETGKQPGDSRQLVSLRKAEFQVGGASCVTCLRKIEHRLRLSPGVLKAEVNIISPHQAVIFFDERKTDPHLVWMPLGKDGYTMTNLKVTPAAAVPAGLIFGTIKEFKRKDNVTVAPPAPIVD